MKPSSGPGGGRVDMVANQSEEDGEAIERPGGGDERKWELSREMKGGGAIERPGARKC